MNVMFPEAFTTEYEEFMALLAPDYIVVQIIGNQLYRISEPAQDINKVWDEMEQLEKAHPENAYLTYTLTEYEEWITER